MTIGERIRDQRLQKTMTLGQLAAAVGVSEATVQRYEAGIIKNINPEMVKKLADALGTTASWLLGERDKVPANTRMVEMSIRETITLLAFRCLPKRERVLIQQLIMTMNYENGQYQYTAERLKKAAAILKEHGLEEEYEQAMAEVDAIEIEGIRPDPNPKNEENDEGNKEGDDLNAR